MVHYFQEPGMHGRETGGYEHTLMRELLEDVADGLAGALEAAEKTAKGGA